MAAIPYMSNRFALSRFLGLSEEEIKENERMWREENEENLQPFEQDVSAEMRGAGIGGGDIAADLEGIETEGEGAEGGITAGEATPPETVTGTELGTPPPGTEQTI